jgi:hypothetical protein
MIVPVGPNARPAGVASILEQELEALVKPLERDAI